MKTSLLKSYRNDSRQNEKLMQAGKKYFLLLHGLSFRVEYSNETKIIDKDIKYIDFFIAK